MPRLAGTGQGPPRPAAVRDTSLTLSHSHRRDVTQLRLGVTQSRHGVTQSRHGVTQSRHGVTRHGTAALTEHDGRRHSQTWRVARPTPRPLSASPPCGRPGVPRGQRPAGGARFTQSTADGRQSIAGRSLQSLNGEPAVGRALDLLHFDLLRGGDVLLEGGHVASDGEERVGQQVLGGGAVVHLHLQTRVQETLRHRGGMARQRTRPNIGNSNTNDLRIRLTRAK